MHDVVLKTDNICMHATHRSTKLHLRNKALSANKQDNVPRQVVSFTRDYATQTEEGKVDWSEMQGEDGWWKMFVWGTRKGGMDR